MTLSLDASLRGMLEHQRALEMTSNNLANVNTTGYKRVKVHFQALLDTAEILQAVQGNLPVQDATTTGGVATDAIDRVFEQGALQQSDSVFDLAIVGPGLFKVQLEDGSTAFTRDGSFRLDAERRLAMSDGTRLEPPITVPDTYLALSIDREGNVLARRVMTEAELAAREPDDPATEVEEIVGTISLVRFDNPELLAGIGKNLYLATAGSGPAIEGAPSSDGFGFVVNSFLETSNVDAAEELTNLVVHSRAYQMNLTAFRTIEEMLRQAGQLPA